MSRYLVKTTEQWRVGSEKEAEKLINENKSDVRFILLKSSSEYKTIKSKGEIVEEYWRVTLVKQFTEEKDPMSTVNVSYDVAQRTSFPSTEEEE